MKKAELGQKNRIGSKARLNNAIHSVFVKKLSMFDNKNCKMRKNIHKVEVIFSSLRLEKKQEKCFNGICDKFTNLQNCSIIPTCEYFVQKEVEYCYGGMRRASKRFMPLWTARKTTCSHLFTKSELFTDKTSSAEFERGNVRYIAKIRLMKGENA